MKPIATHLVLVLVFTTMASLKLFAQKRFDNPQKTRKIVVTKMGPKSMITEKWIRFDSLSENQKEEILRAFIQDSKSTHHIPSDSDKLHDPQGSPLNNYQSSGGEFRRKNARRNITMFGSKILDN